MRVPRLTRFALTTWSISTFTCKYYPFDSSNGFWEINMIQQMVSTCSTLLEKSFYISYLFSRWFLVFSKWFLVFCTWFPEFGKQFLVFSKWFLVFSKWFPVFSKIVSSMQQIVSSIQQIVSSIQQMVSRIQQMVSTCARNSFWILQKWQIKKPTHFTMYIYIFIL